MSLNAKKATDLGRGLTIVVLLLSVAVATCEISDQENGDQSPNTGHGHEIMERPNMVVFQKIDIYKNISIENVINLGTVLLNDELGIITEDIEYEKKGDNMKKKIFQRWLKGEGITPVTWDTLINELSKMKLHSLADELKRKVMPKYLHAPALNYDYSEAFLKGREMLRKRYKEQQDLVSGPLNAASDLPFQELVVRKRGTGVRISLKDTLQRLELKKRKRLLVIGQPGSGKTTLMRYLAKMWAKGKTLQSCQLLFLVRLDECRAEYHRLSELLDVTYKYLGIPFDEIQQRFGNGTCLLMDAFDEKDHKSDESDYVYKMFWDNELPHAIRILTSRPTDTLILVGNEIEVVGFQPEKLDSYVDSLAVSQSVKKTIFKLWEDEQVKEMCQLPLHFHMIVHIAKSPSVATIKTRTQIYTAFMNATIKHFKHNNKKLEAVSLRECILDARYDELALCEAFRTIHTCSFRRTNDHVHTFPLTADIQSKSKKLGFVSFSSDNTISEEVEVIFSHPSLVDYFTAIHLITLPQDDQILYSQKLSTIIKEFYFGLLGDFYANNISAVSVPLRAHTFSSQNTWVSICENGFHQAIDYTSLRLHEEIGWTGQLYRALLQSSGIVVDSSTCIASQNISHLQYLLEHGQIRKLSLIGYSEHLPSVSVEQDDYLTSSHLQFLSDCSSHSFKPKRCYTQLQTSASYYYVTPAPSLVNFDIFIQSLLLSDVSKTRPFGLPISTYLTERIVFDDVKDEHVSVKEILSTFNITYVGLLCCHEELWSLLRAFPNARTLAIVLTSDCMSKVQLTPGPEIPPFHYSNSIWPKYLTNMDLMSDVSPSLLSYLGSIPKLRFLHLTNVQIHDIQSIPTISAKLRGLALTNGTLHHINITILSSVFRSLSTIETLNLENTTLTDSDIITLSQNLTRLRNLKSLNLNANNISGTSLPSLVNALKKIENFTSLKLLSNPITGQENIKALAQLTNLKTLYISTCTLEDRDALFLLIGRYAKLPSFIWTKKC